MKNTPNILLITCDQLRFDYIKSYGADFMQTPHIDALADDGCLFENCYSLNPVCIPARYNILTGLTARHHGFDDNYFGDMAKNVPYYLPTFPQILSDGGYETIAIGKLHFQPERRLSGFDFFYNMNEIAHTRESDDYHMFLKENGYGHIDSPHGVRTCLYMQPQQSLLPLNLHGSCYVADKAIEYFNTVRNRKPFMMWASFIHPHPPLNVPQGWEDMYKDKIPEPVKSKTPLSTLAKENIALGCLEDADTLKRTRELYASCISFVDHNIGRMIETLKQLDMYDNTVILFTSDHGEMLGDLGTFQKFLAYDASAKVPMILKPSKEMHVNKRESAFVDLNDILPTFLDIAKLKYPDKYELYGESLLQLEGTKNRLYQYAEFQKNNKRWCMIRDKQYKYIYYYGDDDQLFDMINDPSETINLLYNNKDSSIIEIKERLKKILLAYEKRYGLPDSIENGTFKPFEKYELFHYFETNGPKFVNMIQDEEEKKNMMPYDEEILQAIKNEKVVKLDSNHTYEILKTLGWSDEKISKLISDSKK